MESHKVVVGEFENTFYAKIARRELLTAGIETSLRRSENRLVLPWQIETEAVRLIVDQDQLEMAEKILVKKFVDKLTLIQSLIE